MLKSSSSSSPVFSRIYRQECLLTDCVDKLSSLGGRLFGILRWSVGLSPFHAVSVVGTVPVKTSFETIHCRCDHHFLRQIVPHVDYSVTEEILT